MTRIELPTTAGHLGALFGAPVIGDSGACVSHLAALEKARTGALSFLSNPKYMEHLPSAEGAVLFCRGEMVRPGMPVTYLVVSDPQSSFAEVARHFQSGFSWAGVSPLAIVSSTAEIDSSASVGPYAVIGEGAKVGPRTSIHPFAVVGNGVVIGDDCVVHARATLYDRVRVGNRVKILSGAVIGSEGFGFFRDSDQGPYKEMPHIGVVILEDDVRVGVNVCIDRATLTETRIHRGTKIDNLVHVGHNSSIGEDSILCAQAGLGGSVVLENDVVLGGQVGLGHGVQVGSGARMGGQSGSTTNVAGKQTYFFTPATPIREFTRLWRYLRRLPELVARLRRLEKRIGDPIDG